MPTLAPTLNGDFPLSTSAEFTRIAKPDENVASPLFVYRKYDMIKQREVFIPTCNITDKIEPSTDEGS